MIEVKEQLKDVESVFPIDESTIIIAGHPRKEFIKEYIIKYDNDFYEPLSERVDMDQYGQKLSDLSTTFILYKGNEVAGLMCSYFYDPSSKVGFNTLLHTKLEYRGKHLSLYILDAVKEYARKHGFEKIAHYTNKQQTSAFQLYIRHGFTVVEEEESGRCKVECKLK